MKQTTLSREDEVLEKYYIFYERRVRAGMEQPLDGQQRLILEKMVDWLCERYTIVSKQRKGRP